MAEPKEGDHHDPKIDPKSGFCSETKIYHSLLSQVSLPPENACLSVSHYIFSLFHQTASAESSSTTTTAMIDSATGDRLTYSEFFQHIQSLTISLQNHQIGLSKGDTAFILSPTSLQIPILYLSLLSLGVVISPSNPTNTVSDISHQLSLCKPTLAFATADTAHKLPSFLRRSTILLDSPDFTSMTTKSTKTTAALRKLTKLDSVVEVSQSDTAAILYSSGTTGRVKGVVFTHRNLISAMAEVFHFQAKSDQSRASSSSSSRVVLFSAVPFFHVYGFSCCLNSVAMGQTMVTTTKRFDVGRMLKAVENYKVTLLAVAPPVLVAMAKGVDLDMINGYDLSSLECMLCGGAPLATEVIARIRERLPNVILLQGYGLTECMGRATAPIDSLETNQPIGSVGKLAANLQAKIVDPDYGAALPPWKQGELWIKGPPIMKGYVGNEDAVAATLDSDGWLRTGDLCYVDDDGFLFVIDRLKELIKYKGYQVPPAELEALLQSHPDIVDASVIPYPNEEAGQVPMAFVVRRPECFMDESQVMDFIAKQVAPYKKVRRVAFIDAIPRNASGKILRKELIKLALITNPTAKL